MEKEKLSLQKHVLNKDRLWNLLFLLVGAALGFGLNALHEHIQHKQQIGETLTMIHQDVEYQISYSKMLVTGLSNLKNGKFPNITQKSPTLDQAFYNADLKIGMSLRDHKSPISDHILSRIHLLPKQITKDVLEYYSNVFYCQTLKNECQEALANRQFKKSEKPAPICDVYLDVLQTCVKLGENLLTKLKAIQ